MSIDVSVYTAHPGSWRIQLPSGERVVECKRSAKALLIRDGVILWTVEGKETVETLHLTINGAQFAIAKRPPPRVDWSSSDRRGEDAAAVLEAPMTGRLVKVAVQEGETVVSGQTVAVIEAMKMEHAVAAPRAGTIARILYQLGDIVQAGALLAEMEE